MKKTLIFTIATLIWSLALQNTTWGQDGQNDGRCNPLAEVEPIIGNIENMIYHGDTLTPVNGDLPHGDYVIIINGFIEYFNKNGAIDNTFIEDGDEVCVIAFTYDLDSINVILDELYIACGIGACPFEPIAQELIRIIALGLNDGVPGVNSIEELVDLLNGIGGFLDEEVAFPIRTIPEAYDIIDVTNDEIASDYGHFCYAGSSALCHTVSLPIELKSFTGNANNCAIKLNWETANERNFSHFEIQKSYDGADFHAVSRVESINGNTSDGDIYNYVDTENIKSRNYYRLKIVDEDDSFTYSDIIVINSECTENNSPTINIYPNPVRGDVLSVELFVPLTNNVKIQITDQLGRPVAEKYTDVTNGFNLLEMNINQLDANTIYFLNIQSNDWLTSIKRFVKT